MTAEQKISLINEVLKTAYSKTESWSDDDFIGANLAYLVFAITDNSFVDWSPDLDNRFIDAIRSMFVQWFPENHTVWLFIKT